MNGVGSTLYNITETMLELLALGS